MTRTTWTVALCACLLVMAAVLIEILGGGDSSSAPHTTAVALTTAPSRTETPTTSSPAGSPSATSTPPVADVTLEIAKGVLPKPTGGYASAKQPVELSAICSGAVLDLGGDVQAAYISLQTVADPLRFVDVAVGVFGDADSASAAYTVLTGQVNDCPTDRTVTPTPADGETPGPVAIAGEASPARVAATSAIQWTQQQTSAAPATSLRTSVTVFVFHNAIVAVSMDEDSESVEAPALQEASRAAAESILTALQAAVA